MTILSAQSISNLCVAYRLINPWTQRASAFGMSYGVGPAGYDVRIKDSISLGPQEFGLGSTIEQFDLPWHIMMHIRDKSTWARRGLSVFNSCAEPGWRGYLTIELVNHGPERIDIVAGMPIAHCVFETLDQPTFIPYVGKYQDQPNHPVAARVDDPPADKS